MPEENTTNYPSQSDMVDRIVDDMQVWDHEALLAWAQGARRAILLDVSNHVLREIYIATVFLGGITDD